MGSEAMERLCAWPNPKKAVCGRAFSLCRGTGAKNTDKRKRPNVRGSGLGMVTADPVTFGADFRSGSDRPNVVRDDIEGWF